MSYAGEKIIYDADSHLMELPDFLDQGCHSDDARHLGDLTEIMTGQFDPGEVSSKSGHAPDTVSELLALGDNLTRGPKWHAALGAFNGRERSKALDLLGFKKQVIFSSLCSGLIFRADKTSAYVSAAAHNRAMAEFCGSDARLLGIAMVPLQDISRAELLIDDALKFGLSGVWISSEAPAGKSPGHPDMNSIWSRLEEAGIPFILHVGSSTLSIDDVWMNDGNPTTQTARGGAEVIGSKDLTVIHHSAQRFISTLVLDGVLERFPRLTGGVIELGAGWVPDMIRRLDHAVTIWARSEPQLGQMSRLPSQQIAQQLRFTPYPFEDVAQLVSESCGDLYMFSSDYPHAEGGRDPIGRFSSSTKSLNEMERNLFFAENFQTLWK